MFAEKIVKFQPSIPTVYGDPVEECLDYEEYKFQCDSDELVDLVNRHADYVSEAAQEARSAERRRIIAGMNITLISAVTIFAGIGIWTVFHWILG